VDGLQPWTLWVDQVICDEHVHACPWEGVFALLEDYLDKVSRDKERLIENGRAAVNVNCTGTALVVARIAWVQRVTCTATGRCYHELADQ